MKAHKRRVSRKPATPLTPTLDVKWLVVWLEEQSETSRNFKQIRALAAALPALVEGVRPPPGPWGLLARTESEMHQQMNRAAKKGTLFRGRTYEQGVEATLQWVRGLWEDKPLSDDDYSEYD